MGMDLMTLRAFNCHGKFEMFLANSINSSSKFQVEVSWNYNQFYDFVSYGTTQLWVFIQHFLPLIRNLLIDRNNHDIPPADMYRPEPFAVETNDVNMALVA